MLKQIYWFWPCGRCKGSGYITSKAQSCVRCGGTGRGDLLYIENKEDVSIYKFKDDPFSDGVSGG